MEDTRTENLITLTDEFLFTGFQKSSTNQYLESIRSVSPLEVLEIFNYLSGKSWSDERIKVSIQKLCNFFYKPLLRRRFKSKPDNFILNQLISDNRNVEVVLSEMKHFVKQSFIAHGEILPQTVNKLKGHVNGLLLYKIHHRKMEQLLFPNLQNSFFRYSQYLKIHSGFLSDYSTLVHKIQHLLSGSFFRNEAFNRSFGKLCFLVFMLIFCEEHILYPVCQDHISPWSWDIMRTDYLRKSWV